jgi:hypothetical protein
MTAPVIRRLKMINRSSRRALGRPTLVTLGALTLALMAVAPTVAQARWRTGEGHIPAQSDEQVCHNGVTWRYATIAWPYLTTTGQPNPDGIGAPRTLHIYDVVAFLGEQFEQNPTSVLTKAPVLEVPFDPIWVDPHHINGGVEDWIPDYPGLFDYSAIYTLQFDNVQPANFHVTVQWREPARAEYEETFGYPDWTTRNCYLIDVEPREFPNRVSPRVPADQMAVAVLTTHGLNASKIKPKSVRFGTAGRRAKPRGTMKLHDVDGDGDLDSVFRFATRDAGVNCHSSKVKLKVKLTGGKIVTGFDSVQPVGC